jgi:hypothetical protein
MNGKIITRAATSADLGQYQAILADNPPGAHANRLSSRRMTTVMTLVVCSWSLLALSLDLGIRGNNIWMVGDVAARLVLVVAGLSAVVDVRFARAGFSFLCGVSVLAVAPRLPLQFERSMTDSLVLLVECASKAVFILLVCIDSLRDVHEGDPISRGFMSMSRRIGAPVALQKPGEY